MYVGLHVKCPFFSSDFNETWISQLISEIILKYQIPWKSVQWKPSCSVRTGRHDEADNRFSQLCERALKTRNRIDSANWPTACASEMKIQYGWTRYFYSTPLCGTLLNVLTGMCSLRKNRETFSQLSRSTKLHVYMSQCLLQWIQWDRNGTKVKNVTKIFFVPLH
jgi:hypothetical protein